MRFDELSTQTTALLKSDRLLIVDLRRLAVIQNLVKKHHLKKTHKEPNNNNNNINDNNKRH